MNFLILHGTTGSPDASWLPWLAGELEKLGHKTLRPQLPTPEGQTPANWLKVITDSVEKLGGAGDNLIIIAHSMSPLAVCHYLQTISTPIKACFFVCGFASDLPLDEEPYVTLNMPFIKVPVNWTQVRAGSAKFICFSGDNDPYVPLDISQDFAQKLGTQPIVIPGGGHLNVNFGYTKFPQLFISVRSLLNS